VQLRLARNKLVKLTKEKMKESLPNVAKAERIKVYNFVKEIFNNFENEVTQRIDSDISSRKLELEELLAQKASQEIDKTAEVSRLNTLDSHILTQWNAVEAITDKLLEETV
jgi:phenylalanyl-tRNA synthetase alpha subunit